MDLSKLFKLFDTVSSKLSGELLKSLRVDIAMIGITGVGKTTTCNSLLGTNWEIGHTEGTTRKTQIKNLVIDNGEPTNIYITDFPGLGESIKRDKEYLPLYCELLSGFDAVIWLLPANNREMSSIQSYCNKIKDKIPDFDKKIIFGLNKSDLVEPMNWGVEETNLPSVEQEGNIYKRVEDVVLKMNEEESDCKITKDRVIPFSAKNGWRMWDLFKALNETLTGPKKMSLVRFAKPEDWKPEKR